VSRDLTVKDVKPVKVSLGRLAQAPPPTADVYLATFGQGAEPPVSNVVNISDSPSYNNQPSFTPDGKAVLFTSRRDGTQTDIYKCDVATKALTQLTHTAENEYSPLVTPDGQGFSVVHGDEQSLWRFNLDGSGGKLLYAHTGKIGYHVWVDATHLALFILGESGQPATLQYVDLATGKADVIEPNIGRTLLMRPGRNTVSFLSKPRNGHPVIKEFDPATRAVTALMETIDDRGEDFAWDPRGRVVMGSGSSLYLYSATLQVSGWYELANLAASGLDKITRIAFAGRGSQLFAFVAETKKKH